MKPILILLAALSVTAPVHAQEQLPRLYGNLAGRDYCRQRLAGLSHDQALEYAVEENMADYDTEPVFEGPYGETTHGAMDMLRFIDDNCPQMWPSGANL